MNQYQLLAIKVELLKEEIRCCPANFDEVATETFAIFDLQTRLIQLEEQEETGE